MNEARKIDAIGRDVLVLVDRLVRRQGLTRDQAVRLVDDYRKGRRAEIDPALMEGLEAI